MLAIQCISTQALRAGRHHAEWNTYDSLIGVDYSSVASVTEAAGLLELDADGAYQYRIVEVASVEDSYLELQAENTDALEALAAWVTAGCPRNGNAIQDVERAALACVRAAPVTVVRKTEVA
jgi:hypothetical protein